MQPHLAKLTHRWMVAFLLLLTAAPSAVSQAADPALAGLKGVELGIELQNESETRLGLTADRAYRVVEEELGNAGVSFLPAPAQSMDVGRRIQRMQKGYALLFFQVTTVADENLEGYAVDLSFQLLDRVRLARDTSKETVASLYRGRHLVLMKGRGSAGEAEQRLRTMAREFAAHFKASNPGANRKPTSIKR